MMKYNNSNKHSVCIARYNNEVKPELKIEHDCANFYVLPIETLSITLLDLIWWRAKQALTVLQPR